MALSEFQFIKRGRWECWLHPLHRGKETQRSAWPFTLNAWRLWRIRPLLKLEALKLNGGLSDTTCSVLAVAVSLSVRIWANGHTPPVKFLGKKKKKTSICSGKTGSVLYWYEEHMLEIINNLDTLVKHEVCADLCYTSRHEMPKSTRAQSQIEREVRELALACLQWRRPGCITMLIYAANLTSFGAGHIQDTGSNLTESPTPWSLISDRRLDITGSLCQICYRQSSAQLEIWDSEENLTEWQISMLDILRCNKADFMKYCHIIPNISCHEWRSNPTLKRAILHLDN